MCLIIVGKSNQVRDTLLNTVGLIPNIYSRNADGVGMMYHSEKGLVVLKALPDSPEAFADFVRLMPQDDREIAIHARYKTHGDIDLDQCHPYTVVEGELALMHNGVLEHGNADDLSKSDTWHYIANTVRPMAEQFPDIIHNEAWQNLIASDIGRGNRFVYLDKAGKMVVLNRHTGIEHEGMWFSNTYAWTPQILIPTWQPFKPKNPWGKQSWTNPMFRSPGLSPAQQAAIAFAAEDEYYFDANDVITAVETKDQGWFEDLLHDYPRDTVETLFEVFQFEPVDPEVDEANFPMADARSEIISALEAADVGLVTAAAIDDALMVADTIFWWGELTAHEVGYDEHPEFDLEQANAELEEEQQRIRTAMH